MSARGRHLDCVSARRLRQCDIAADIDQTSSTESLQRACMTATQALDYDFCLLGGYYPIVEGIVMSSRFPAAWRSRYDSNNYLAIDPVVRHCWQESSAVVWSRIRHA